MKEFDTNIGELEKTAFTTGPYAGHLAHRAEYLTGEDKQPTAVHYRIGNIISSPLAEDFINRITEDYQRLLNRKKPKN